MQLGLPLRQTHQLHIQHEGGKLATCFIIAVNILAYLYLYFIQWFEIQLPSLLGASVFSDNWLRLHRLIYCDFSHKVYVTLTCPTHESF